AHCTLGRLVPTVSRPPPSRLFPYTTLFRSLPADCDCRYVVYCDDLAFNGQDESYRTLKSVLDGALDSEQDKLLVYATSNRRHLLDRKSTRLNPSHVKISYAVFCLKQKTLPS